MDSMTIILNALATSKVADNQIRNNQDIMTTYKTLRTIIQQKFASKPEALLALKMYEEKPEIWKAPLRDELEQAHIDQDQEIVTTAQQLLTQIQPQQQVVSELIDTRYREYLLEYDEAARNYKRRLYFYVIFGIIFSILLITLAIVYFFTPARTFIGNILPTITIALSSFIAVIVGFLVPGANRNSRRKEETFDKLIELEKYKDAVESVQKIDSKDQKLFTDTIIQQLIEPNNIKNKAKDSSQ